MSEYERVQPITTCSARCDPDGPVTEEQHEALVAMGFMAAGDGDYIARRRNPYPQLWVWAPESEKNETQYGAQIAQRQGDLGPIVRFDDPVVAAVYLLTLG